MKQVAELSWLGIVWRLLGSARRRARARSHAQAARKNGMSPGLLFGIALFGAFGVQFLLASLINISVSIASDLAAGETGKIRVSSYLYDTMIEHDKFAAKNSAYLADLAKWEDETNRHSNDDSRAKVKKNLDTSRESVLRSMDYAARSKARRSGVDEQQLLERMKREYAAHGSAAFEPEEGFGNLESVEAHGALGFFIALWWLSMVLQGEGMAFDVTRRRHPMWEWYLYFPIPQSAAFAAEAVAPAVSNPFLIVSPVLLAALVGHHQGSFAMGLAALPFAIPLTLAAALWAKALEVLIMLRCSVRSRSAWFVLMAGIGFLALFSPMIPAQSPAFARRFFELASPLTAHLQGVRYLLDFDDLPSWLRAMGFCIVTGLVLAIPAFVLLRVALARGLESGFGHVDTVASTSAFRQAGRSRSGWLGDPLLHKDWLWLKRDRGALVQLIAVPLLLVSLQLFNLRNALHSVELTWNKLAAVVVGMGTYMLFITGPRALLSEGPALQLTLSWPRSLEDTLRMKVRLLFALVSAMVWLCLGVLMWMYPHDWAKLLAVAAIWPMFGLSVAEKAVTLIRAPTQSGEPEPVPQSHAWAASLGNFLLAIALFTAQWQLAAVAIAMNWVFAGALWQGFRHRLPYLFDSASEPQLRPPTVLSSLVAIVGLMEFGAVVTVLLMLAVGPEGSVFARVMGYGIVAVVVCSVVASWHWDRGVTVADILRMDEGARFVAAGPCLLAAAAGILLGLLGVGYQHLVLSAPWPEVREPMEKTMEFFAESPNARTAYAIMAIGIAPWVEEFLFRGLLFRALLPQWGLGLAVVGSSAFFAILHPALAWPMVFSLGAINAYMFVRTRSLIPCIVLHACYNAVVIGIGI